MAKSFRVVTRETDGSLRIKDYSSPETHLGRLESEGVFHLSMDLGVEVPIVAEILEGGVTDQVSDQGAGRGEHDVAVEPAAVGGRQVGNPRVDAQQCASHLVRPFRQ